MLIHLVVRRPAIPGSAPVPAPSRSIIVASRETRSATALVRAASPYQHSPTGNTAVSAGRRLPKKIPRATLAASALPCATSAPRRSGVMLGKSTPNQADSKRVRSADTTGMLKCATSGRSIVGLLIRRSRSSITRRILSRSAQITTGSSITNWYPCRDSNPNRPLRRRMLYPVELHGPANTRVPSYEAGTGRTPATRHGSKPAPVRQIHAPG